MNDDDQSPWTRPSVIGSGVFILLLAIAAVVILILPGGHKHHHAVAQVPTTTTSTTSTAPKGTVTPPSKGPCTLPAGSQVVPSSTPPKGITWQTVDAMAVPQAPDTYGPQHVKDGYDVCFAHSPVGALLAALNLYAAATTNPPKRVFHALAIDVPGQIKDNTELDDGAGNVEIAGYKYSSYSPGRATVAVVLAYPNNAYQAVLTNLAWTHDDWKIVYPVGGILPHQQLSSLSGYVQWKDF